jgi:alkanesulfonate monooxygenase SsuD/methylene tetrahydromethanopterin reductase-like flavin-dependent oxidoreductase (luciferase family)
VHDQHCVGLNEADHAAWEAGGDRMLEDVTISGTADQVRERLAALADQGVTEIVYQPCRPEGSEHDAHTYDDAAVRGRHLLRVPARA